MARRTATGKTATQSRSVKDQSTAKAADSVEQKVVALAEQMGRLIGTVQGKAEGWLDPHYMRDQLTRIQDGATDLLGHLGGTGVKPAPAARQSSPRGRSGGKVDAPGKKHRPPPPSIRAAKPAKSRVAKTNAKTRSVRRPRQG